MAKNLYTNFHLTKKDFYTNFTPIMCKDMWIYNRLREMTACRKIPANAEK